MTSGRAVTYRDRAVASLADFSGLPSSTTLNLPSFSSSSRNIESSATPRPPTSAYDSATSFRSAAAVRAPSSLSAITWEVPSTST